MTNASQIPVGNSASNKVSVGRAYASSLLFTNLNGSGTLSNLASVIIPTNALARKDDTIRLESTIKLANAAPNTNQFQVVYGSEIPLDTGLQQSSNCVVVITATIVRTGPLAELCKGRLEWGPAGGVPYGWTNFMMVLAQTNNIDTLLSIRSAARRPGAHTNVLFEVWHTSVLQ